MSTQEESAEFTGFGLSAPVLDAVAKMGFAEATPIQKKALPYVLEGKDVFGQAQTGTGKTAAFGIPIAQRLPADADRVVALVLCPTRELAVQVSEEIHEICLFAGHKVLPVYGGQRIDRQINALRKGVQVVVGTPGRILDHLGRGTLDLSGVQMVVLDEADMMLDMGFLPDIRRILRKCPRERQTLLFSATIPEEIQRIARDYMKDPEWLSVVPETLTLDETEQIFYEVPEEEKLEALTRLLDLEDEGSSAIVFCRTRRNVEKLARKLKARGYDVEGLHGDLGQPVRDRIMQGFRDGKFSFLVATDVASRGLDISHVTHVINYHIPQDPEAYVHRIGRTGRMGREGIAVTFVTPAEYWDLLRIQEFSQAHIEEGHLPSLTEVDERRRAAKGDEEAKRRVKYADSGSAGRSSEDEAQPAGIEPAAEKPPPVEASAEEPVAAEAGEREPVGEKPLEDEQADAFGLPEPAGKAETEAERQQRRYVRRDAEKRIAWAEAEQALEEAARIEHERRVESARAEVSSVKGDEAGDEEEQRRAEERRRLAEEKRRRDVEARLQEAERVVSEEGDRAAPSEQEPAEPAEPEGALTPEDEERIVRALRLRDRVRSLAADLSESEIQDYVAVVDRLAGEFELRRLAAALLREVSRQEFGTEIRAGQGRDVRHREDAQDDEMVRLFISIGRKSKMGKEDLEKLVRESAGISEDDVGRIDLLHRFAFVEVRKAVAGKVIEEMHESMFRGREISVEHARSKTP